MYRDLLQGNNENLNSATLNYYQQGIHTAEGLTKMLVLENILNTHVFTYLRTERQLGYVAFAKIVRHGCVDGFVIAVEGSKEAPHNVDKIIDDALEDFETKLKKLSDTEFNNIKDSVKSEFE